VGFSYPQQAAERTQWIVARRPARNAVDPSRPYAFCVEQEPTETGAPASVVTIFLTNRECPWHCLMCDLWRNTLTEIVPPGAIPAQIDYALQEIKKESFQKLTDDSAAPSVKLYNSGSFFDPGAIPVEDYSAIARRVDPFQRVIVECHPTLIGDACLRFRDLLGGALEIAMGLETVHEQVLDRLNKRMTLSQFSRAAQFLKQNDIALRVFILVKPPFLDEAEGLCWAQRSLDFAFDNNAGVCSLIPTRPGNGALDSLMERADFSPPKLTTLESALEYGIKLGRGRVFADLWDLERFADCAHCFPSRAQRLQQMNLQQRILPRAQCQSCGAGM
jgi:archaeosine synthase beta-subunit